MITGFNTDIDFDGQTFHVQTEDKGVDHPVIETLVYTGGQIVCARKTPYAELVADGGAVDAEIQQRMEAQHRALIQEIRDGTLTKEDLEPFGWNIISNQSFEQVVRTFIAEQVPLESICLEWLEPKELRAGETPTLKLAVTDETRMPVVSDGRRLTRAEATSPTPIARKGQAPIERRAWGKLSQVRAAGRRCLVFRPDAQCEFSRTGDVG